MADDGVARISPFQTIVNVHWPREKKKDAQPARIKWYCFEPWYPLYDWSSGTNGQELWAVDDDYVFPVDWKYQIMFGDEGYDPNQPSADNPYDLEWSQYFNQNWIPPGNGRYGPYLQIPEWTGKQPRIFVQMRLYYTNFGAPYLGMEPGTTQGWQFTITGPHGETFDGAEGTSGPSGATGNSNFHSEWIDFGECVAGDTISGGLHSQNSQFASLGYGDIGTGPNCFMIRYRYVDESGNP